MRSVLLALSVSAFLSACSTVHHEQKIQLSWSTGANNPYRYDVVIKQLDAEIAPKLDYATALKSLESFKSELNKIKDFDPGKPNHIAVVTFKDGAFEAQVFQPVPTARDEEGVIELGKGDALQTILFGKFDKKGNNLSFYLPQKQKNLLNLFFDVPDTPLEENITWERGINAIQIGQHFVPQSVKRQEANRLIDTTRNSRDDLLVHIGGVNKEAVGGKFVSAELSTTIQASYEYTYFFYGVFNVTQGYWEQNTTVTYFNDLANKKFIDLSVYAITKVND